MRESSSSVKFSVSELFSSVQWAMTSRAKELKSVDYGDFRAIARINLATINVIVEITKRSGMPEAPHLLSTRDGVGPQSETNLLRMVANEAAKFDARLANGQGREFSSVVQRSEAANTMVAIKGILELPRQPVHTVTYGSVDGLPLAS